MRTTCLCCLTSFEDSNCEKICKSCSESWVCNECLPEYRKYWNQKCCICKEGIGVVEPSNESLNEQEPESRKVKFLFAITCFLAYLSPLLCCYLWVAYPMGESNTVEFILDRIIPYYFGYSITLVYMEYKSGRKLYLIYVNLWFILGHGLYIGVSFLSESYGNLFMYYGMVCGGGIFLLMGFALGMGVVELIRKIFVRTQPILPI